MLRTLRPPRFVLLAAIAVCLSSSSGVFARAASAQRAMLAASGVRTEQIDRYDARLAELVRAIREIDDPAADARTRARAIHEFLHRRVLAGKYEPSASDLGVVLDGGPFNCAATSALFSTLAAACGLEVEVLSVPGHVWCRVYEFGVGARSPASPVSGLPPACDVETTCADWFAIVEKYAGVPTEKVSAAMAAHRRRATEGRSLAHAQLLAIFHFNRGVTYLRQQQFAAAALANFRALALDPACVPAYENLQYAAKWLAK